MSSEQRRTHKMFMGGFHSVAYGGHLFVVYGLCDVTIWRHIWRPVSKPTFWRSFVDIIYIFFYTHSPYFMCHCTESKLSALQVRVSKENKLSAATQQFITQNFGCVLKKGNKTHSSLRQSNLQLQNEVALSRRIRAVEHRCAHRRTERHFTGGAENICPESNFFV